MSRSYRRPFAAVTGTASAKPDKRMAHRGVRRKQNPTLKTCPNYEVLLLPHPLNCTWNDTWVWSRDGGQAWHGDLRLAQDESGKKYYRKLLRK
ncbi:MAG TPA: hypothetical protein VGG26_04655 [Terracidiphilus sp.]|jgi:hypothetical protein